MGKTRNFSSHSRLIDDLGGPTKVAALIHETTGVPLKRQAVSMMRRRGIAWMYRYALANVARERGIEVPADFLGYQDQAAA